MFAALWHYWACIVLMMVGLYAVTSRDNLVKKIMGLTLTQVSVIMFFVAMGKVRGGTAPILVKDAGDDMLFSNPVPHVLMLTAIVVGVATNALALAIIVRIREGYGTCEEDEIELLDHAEAEEEARDRAQANALESAGGGA